MQTYSEDTMVKDVRIAIDENTKATAFTDDDGVTFDADTLEMEEIIKSKIPDAINAVRMAAPLRMLELTPATPTVAWTDESKGIGRVALPSDFMRFGRFKMSDWLYGAYTAITPQSEEYGQQFSEYQGVRGNPSRPVVAIASDDGGATLEFFSCADTGAVASLLYVGRQERQSASYPVEESIYRAVVLKTAALVMANYSNADLMQLLNNLCLEQLQLAVSN